MVTMTREVLKVKREPTMLKKKSIIWHIDQDEYVVRNVPYIEIDAEGEEFLDANVSITITALRDLMYDGAIPRVVDYEQFAHIEF